MWIQNLLQSLASTDTAEEAFDVVAKITQEMGFDYCCYGIRMSIPVSRPTVRILDNYPSGWMKHYQEHGYLRVDPTVRLGITQTTSILWNDETFKTAPELWDDARSFGLNVGIAQPVWGADGSFGLLSLAREAEQLTAAEENLQCLRMAWMAQTTHAIIGSMLKSFLNLPVQAQLTQRELEILCWTAEGKTASEIGLILGLSDRTINFHINNFVRKLECNNKIQAAVKAVAIGLLKS